MEQKAEERRFADWRDPSYKGSAAEFPWMPGYLIKLEPEGRIKGGEILKKCVEEENLDLLLIPEQTHYSITESEHSKTPLRALCICKKIEGSQGRNFPSLDLKQTQQLITLVKKTGIGDLKWRNLVHSGYKIGVIDTDAFWGVRLGLISLLENNSFDFDAKALLEAEIMQFNAEAISGVVKK